MVKVQWLVELLPLLLNVLSICCDGQDVVAPLRSSTKAALNAPAIHLELPLAFADTPRTTPKPEIQLFHIALPANGSANTLPLNVRYEIAVDDVNSAGFFRRYRNHLFCLEIDEQWKQCAPLQAASPIPSHLMPGEHSMVAYLVEKTNSSGNSERFLESGP